MYLKSIPTRTKNWLCEWTRQLLLAHPDRQFELVLLMSLAILGVTLLCAPILLLKQVSLASFIASVFIAVGYFFAPRKKVLWIVVFWALWQMQATVGAYLQGGIWSPYVGYYFICSMSILITMGWRWALTTMGFTTLAIAGLFGLEFKSMIPQSQIPRSDWLWPTISSSMLIIALGALPILAYGGRVRRIRKLNEDSHRLRIAQAKLREHQVQQQQFVESVSHELRTPMNAIMGFLQSIDRTQVASAEEQAQFEMMERNAAILLDRINALLDFSKLYANQLALQIKPFDLNEWIERLDRRYQKEVESKNLEWQCSADRRLPSWTTGDPHRIEQILSIVLGNAIMYTKQGRIQLRVEYLNGAKVRFTVSDTGIGIAEPDIQVLFSHLANRSDRKNRAHGGTGIGLSTAQALLDLMQGSIQISSSPGTGTQVAIEIPLAPIGRPTSIPTLTPTFDPNITGTILLVDDSEANRLIARHLIQKHMPNVKILEAACGEDSIALAKAHQPQVILMDLRLPNISGSQATATILASQESAQPWVFGLTADPGEAAIGDAYAAGMRGIIMKPFDAADLATCLAQAIQEATEARITRLT